MSLLADQAAIRTRVLSLLSAHAITHVQLSEQTGVSAEVMHRWCTDQLPVAAHKYEHTMNKLLHRMKHWCTVIEERAKRRKIPEEINTGDDSSMQSSSSSDSSSATRYIPISLQHACSLNVPRPTTHEEVVGTSIYADNILWDTEQEHITPREFLARTLTDLHMEKSVWLDELEKQMMQQLAAYPRRIKQEKPKKVAQRQQQQQQQQADPEEDDNETATAAPAAASNAPVLSAREQRAARNRAKDAPLGAEVAPSSSPPAAEQQQQQLPLRTTVTYSNPLEVQCHLCHEWLFNESYRVRHMVVHPTREQLANPRFETFTCTLCEAVFTTAQKCIKHMKYACKNRVVRDEMHDPNAVIVTPVPRSNLTGGAPASPAAAAAKPPPAVVRRIIPDMTEYSTKKEQMPCPLCPEVLSSEWNLQRHIIVHPTLEEFLDPKLETYACSHCWSVFIAKNRCYKHIYYTVCKETKKCGSKYAADDHGGADDESSYAPRVLDNVLHVKSIAHQYTRLQKRYLAKKNNTPLEDDDDEQEDEEDEHQYNNNNYAAAPASSSSYSASPPVAAASAGEEIHCCVDENCSCMAEGNNEEEDGDHTATADGNNNQHNAGEPSNDEETAVKTEEESTEDSKSFHTKPEPVAAAAAAPSASSSSGPTPMEVGDDNDSSAQTAKIEPATTSVPAAPAVAPATVSEANSPAAAASSSAQRCTMDDDAAIGAAALMDVAASPAAAAATTAKSDTDPSAAASASAQLVETLTAMADDHQTAAVQQPAAAPHPPDLPLFIKLRIDLVVDSTHLVDTVIWNVSELGRADADIAANATEAAASSKAAPAASSTTTPRLSAAFLRMSAPSGVIEQFSSQYMSEVGMSAEFAVKLAWSIRSQLQRYELKRMQGVPHEHTGFELVSMTKEEEDGRHHRSSYDPTVFAQLASSWHIKHVLKEPPAPFITPLSSRGEVTARQKPAPPYLAYLLPPFKHRIVTLQEEAPYFTYHKPSGGLMEALRKAERIASVWQGREKLRSNEQRKTEQRRQQLQQQQKQQQQQRQRQQLASPAPAAAPASSRHRSVEAVSSPASAAAASVSTPDRPPHSRHKSLRSLSVEEGDGSAPFSMWGFGLQPAKRGKRKREGEGQEDNNTPGDATPTAADASADDHAAAASSSSPSSPAAAAAAAVVSSPSSQSKFIIKLWTKATKREEDHEKEEAEAEEDGAAAMKDEEDHDADATSAAAESTHTPSPNRFVLSLRRSANK